MNDITKPLKTRQERFAQFVAQGIPVERAYEEAGYKSRGHSANVNGSALLQTPEVEARVAEIRDLAAKLGTALLTIVEKRSFLAEVVRTPAGSIGPDSWLCQEFYEKLKVRSKHEDGGPNPEEGDLLLRRRVKMVDKLRAIELDSRLAGHFPKTGAGVEDDEGVRKGLDLEEIRKISERIKIVSPLLVGRQ